MTPRISVLIATADRTSLLADCLASLARSTFTEAEILVLDQSHGPVAPLRGFETGGSVTLRHIRCPRRGKSAALNIGIGEARGAILAFTDDDCLASSDWLEVIAREAATDSDAVALTGRVRPGEPEGESVRAPSLKEDSEERVHRAPESQDVLFGNNMAIPAGVLKRVGPFDEGLGPGSRYPAAEDNDLGYRLLRAGIPIRYLPEMVVTHRSWRDGRTQVELHRKYGVGQGAFYGKHARRGDLHMMSRMARNLWQAGRQAGGAALQGRGYDFRASSAFAGGLLRGFFGAAVGAPANGAVRRPQEGR